MFEIKMDKAWCDAIYHRSAVRRYTGDPTDEQLLALGELCRRLSWQGIRMRLFSGPGLPGNIKGTQVYCAIAIKKGTAPELAGFYAEAVVLQAVSMGLGTCMLGTFQHNVVKAAFKPDTQEDIPVIFAIGQCTPPPYAPKRKPLSTLCGLSDEQIEALEPWQKSALKAAQAAPSAINMQPWRFKAENRALSVVEGSALIKKYAAFDRGIAMLHVALGALAQGREGRYVACEGGYTYKV